MSISSTSDERCTRSQTPQGTPTATTPSDRAYGFSKAGRRVLAELASNDSPVVGLLPASTPASTCKQKSSSGSTVLKSRHELLANMPQSHTVSTPLGESLLRSQVHLLLQRVESDTCPLPCGPREASTHLHLGDALMLSPMMSVAPTPLNTPATMAVTTQAPQPMYVMNVQNASTNGMLSQNAGTGGSSGGTSHHPDVSSVSTAMSADKQHMQLSPLLSEESDVPTSTEIFPGKRVLHFDDDTPCKAAASVVTTCEESGCSSLVGQLDDDEVSEWSMNVNVGSPADKQSIMEQGEGSLIVELGVSSDNDEHMKVQQACASIKVDLLWDRARGRKLTAYRRGGSHYERASEDDGEEEGAPDVEELYYSGNEDAEGGEQLEECDRLCDMFQEMGVEEEEESKGLPRGEGKHIRFLYGEGEEEIVEAMVVKGEEDMLHGCCATRLSGVPASLGRHWRFVEEGEDEESSDEGREASNH